jgi:ribonucleases P/MRP protein subunit RPP40
VEKCNVMHIAYNNKRENYEMDAVDEENDLGVIMQSDLKWNRQCTKAVKTANSILSMIRRFFNYLIKDMALHLYKILLRPHLEYCMQAWRPYLKKT